MKTKLTTISNRSQILVIFAGAIFTIVAFMAMAVDFGYIYLQDAKLGRAADASVLAGVQNSGGGGTNTIANAQAVSVAVRNFAIGNYSELANLTNSNPSGTAVSVTNPITGQITTNFTFIYQASYVSSGKTYYNVMTNVIEAGGRGQINSAKTTIGANAKTILLPSQGFRNLFPMKGIAAAARRPRMIAMVLDRSGSMSSNGGAAALPSAVTNFLGLFDTNVDLISITTFSYNSRLDVPMTSNFWTLGTNAMTNATTGIDFGGYTGASDGLRMGVETLWYGDEEAWNDANTLKYLVFFTDGQFNSFRTLAYTPGYTNVVYGQMGTNYQTNSGATTNLSLIPYHSKTTDWAKDIGSTKFFATNIFVTNAASGTLKSTKVQATNWPGSVMYLMEWVNNDYTPATTINSMTNVLQNSVTNTFETAFNSTNQFIPIVKGVYVSHYTNQVTVTTNLLKNQFIVYFQPGYTNLDVIMNSGSDGQMYKPQFEWTNMQSSSYPPEFLWRSNSGTGSGDRYTNLVQYHPGPATNTTNALGIDRDAAGFYSGISGVTASDYKWYKDFTNGIAYYTSTNFHTNHNIWRSTNLLGEYFYQGMSSFRINGVLYTNATRYWNGTTKQWVRTAGIYTNTGTPTPVDPNYAPAANHTNFGLLFTNVIMVTKITNETTMLGEDQIASFVFSTNTLKGTGNPAFTNGLSLSGTNQLRLFIMPMSVTSPPKAIFYAGPNYNNWTNLWVSSATPNFYPGMSGWNNFIEDESDRAAALALHFARQSNVTIYTVGLGSGINSNIMIQLANDPRYSGYNSTQPEGAYYYAPTGADITNKFKAIAERIRAVVSQ